MLDRSVERGRRLSARRVRDAKFDCWVLLGFVAQAFFTVRFLVQWIASRRAGKSVIPFAFWWFSIGGGLLLLVYALYRRDPVFILGQGFGVFVYLRNLHFVMRERKQARGARSSYAAEQRRRALRHPAGGLVVGVGECRQASSPWFGADDLQAHRQAARR